MRRGGLLTRSPAGAASGAEEAVRREWTHHPPPEEFPLPLQIGSDDDVARAEAIDNLGKAARDGTGDVIHGFALQMVGSVPLLFGIPAVRQGSPAISDSFG